MGIGDDIKNAAQDAAGKVKEGFGNLTNNEEATAEGKLDQAKAQAAKGVENAKEAAAEARDDIKRKIQD